MKQMSIIMTITLNVDVRLIVVSHVGIVVAVVVLVVIVVMDTLVDIIKDGILLSLLEKLNHINNLQGHWYMEQKK